MHKYIWLALFIIIVFAIGAMMGTLYAPGFGYEILVKPSFTPPNWLFAPVWIVLYVMIAIAGCRSFILYNVPVVRLLWIVQMVLNFSWMPVFFGLQMPVVALIILIAMVVCVFLFIVKALDSDKISSLLFVPYLVWIIVATYLNAGIIMLN